MVIDLKVYYIHNRWQQFAIVFTSVVLVAVIFTLSFFSVLKKADNVYKSVITELTVVVDAGHGGIDGGAVAKDGTVEKDINLAISGKLKKLLTLFGYNVVMTRESDELISDEGSVSVRQQKSTDLHNRAKILESYDNAILVSIHQNKYSVSKYYGAQVFYSGNNSESAEIAQSVQDSVVELLQPENTRQIKQSGSEIFLLYTAEKPAIMVECGFMSNLEELLKLKDDIYQSQMAAAILFGINNYYNKKDVLNG